MKSLSDGRVQVAVLLVGVLLLIAAAPLWHFAHRTWPLLAAFMGTSLLLWSLARRMGTQSAAGAFVDFASSVLAAGAVVNLGTGLVLQPWTERTPISNEIFFRNGDLAAAVGTAIQRVVSREAERSADPEVRRELDKIAAAAKDHWLKLMADEAGPRADLLPLSEAKVIGFVRDPSKGSLTQQAWLRFLTELTRRPSSLRGPDLARVAAALQWRLEVPLEQAIKASPRAQVALNWVTVGEFSRLEKSLQNGLEPLVDLASDTHALGLDLIGATAAGSVRDPDLMWRRLLPLAREHLWVVPPRKSLSKADLSGVWQDCHLALEEHLLRTGTLEGDYLEIAHLLVITVAGPAAERLRAAERVLGFEPNDPIARFVAMAACEEAGALTSAIAHAEHLERDQTAHFFWRAAGGMATSLLGGQGDADEKSLEFFEGTGLWFRIANRVAQAYAKKGDGAAAEALLRRIIEHPTRAAAPEDVADAYESLASLREQRGDAAAAIEAYRECLAVRKRAGWGSRELASDYERLARLLEEIGDLEEARSYFEIACDPATVRPVPWVPGFDPLTMFIDRHGDLGDRVARRAVLYEKSLASGSQTPMTARPWWLLDRFFFLVPSTEPDSQATPDQAEAIGVATDVLPRVIELLRRFDAPASDRRDAVRVLATALVISRRPKEAMTWIRPELDATPWDQGGDLAKLCQVLAEAFKQLGDDAESVLWCDTYTAVRNTEATCRICADAHRRLGNTPQADAAEAAWRRLVQQSSEIAEAFALAEMNERDTGADLEAKVRFVEANWDKLRPLRSTHSFGLLMSCIEQHRLDLAGRLCSMLAERSDLKQDWLVGLTGQRMLADGLADQADFEGALDALVGAAALANWLHDTEASAEVYASAALYNEMLRRSMRTLQTFGGAPVAPHITAEERELAAKGQELAHRAVIWAERAGRLDRLASAQAMLGRVAAERREWETARAALERAVELYRRLGDSESMSMALMGLRTAYEQTGRLSAAIECVLQDLALSSPSRLRDAGAHFTLARLYRARGDIDLAAESCRAGLSATEGLGFEALLGGTWETLGELELARHRPDAAREAWAKARELYLATNMQYLTRRLDRLEAELETEPPAQSRPPRPAGPR